MSNIQIKIQLYLAIYLYCSPKQQRFGRSLCAPKNMMIIKERFARNVCDLFSAV